MTKKEIMEEAEWSRTHRPTGYGMVFNVVDCREPDKPLASFDYLPKFKKFINGLRNRKILTWKHDWLVGHVEAFVVVVD